MLRRLIKGTPLEPLARKLWRLIKPLPVDPHDLATMELIRQTLRPGVTAIDVGAHRGQFLKEFFRAAPQSRHVAIEPIPDLAGQLRRDFPGAAVHQVALSDRAGETEFTLVRSNPGFSGMQQRADLRPTEQIEKIRVQVATLDSLLDPELSVGFIKMDIEGAEALAFRGAARTLARWKPTLVFEHGAGGADLYNTTPQDVYDLLHGAHGYRLFELLGDRTPAGLSKEEFVRGYHAGNYMWLALG